MVATSEIVTGLMESPSLELLKKVWNCHWRIWLSGEKGGGAGLKAERNDLQVFTALTIL